MGFGQISNDKTGAARRHDITAPTAGRPRHSRDTGLPWPTRASRAAFFVLVVIVALRPLMGEAHDTAQDVISAGVSALSPAMPARTLAIDGVILLASAGMAAARFRARRWRGTGLEGGLGVLLVAAAISCAAAGQKRVAVNASMDWLCLPVLAMGLAQGVTSTWHRRLLLSVVVASAAANAVECLDQAYLTLPETRRQYEQNREAFWRDRRVPLDSATVRMFEARLRAGEPDGYFFHSNVAGGYLGMTALAAAGLVLGALRSLRKEGRPTEGAATTAPSGVVVVFGAALIVGLVWAMALTGSGGAAGAGAVSVAGWIAGTALSRRPRIGRWMQHRRKTAFLAAWGGVGLAAVAVVGHGVYHRSLPGASLNFRWQYWTASATLIREHFWTGVGRENFGRHYVQYKSIDSPEEVASPHNFLVQAAADWGALGAAGMMLLIVGASWRLVGQGRPVGVEEERRLTEERAGGGAPGWNGPRKPFQGMGRVPKVDVGCGFALAVTVFGVRTLLLGTTDPAYLFVQTFIPGITWITAFLIVMRLTVGVHGGSAAYSLAGAGMCAGLAAFLIQDTINFALFVPGSATAAFALFAAALKPDPALERSGGDDADRGGGSLSSCLAAGTTAALLTAVGLQIRPVFRCNSSLAMAREQTEQIREATGAARDRCIREALEFFHRAERADAWDSTPSMEKADLLAGLWLGGAHVFLSRGFEDVRSALNEAQRRDPMRVEIPRRAARIELEAAARLVGEDEFSRLSRGQHLQMAILAARRALDLYPQDPSGWRLLGECLLQEAELQDSRRLRLEAERALNQALNLDASRPGWEVIRRFSARERADLAALVDRARRGSVSDRAEEGPGE